MLLFAEDRSSFSAVLSRSANGTIGLPENLLNAVSVIVTEAMISLASPFHANQLHVFQL